MLKRFGEAWQALWGGSEVRRRVEEELRFHHEMLSENFRARGMSWAEAEEAARRRFGDADRVRSQCVEISMRSRPPVKLLKLFLMFSFAAGAWLRVADASLSLSQLGNVLMLTAMLGHLLLHVRGMKAPAPLNTRSPPSLLGPRGAPSVEGYDTLGRTPVERLIDDEPHKLS